MPARKAIAVLINPSSAGGRSLRVWPGIEAKLKADGFAVTSHFSESEADFRNHARAFAAKFKHIGICGGDSSLTIAAEELMKKKYSGTLVFLPAGSVNDIVLDIRAQQREKKSPAYLANLKAGNATKTFIGQANWGLGVVVNRWVGKLLHAFPVLRPLQNLIGTFSIIIAHALRREIVRASITADNKFFSGIYSIILVSQIRYWASGLDFCPGASYLKPEFQIVTVRRCGLFRLIRIILAAKKAGHLAFPEVQVIAAHTVHITAVKALSVQIDGDILREAGKEIQHDEFHLRKNKSALCLAL